MGLTWGECHRLRSAKVGFANGTAVNLGPRPILKVLVRPGFSACETVTELSGRGLGSQCPIKQLVASKAKSRFALVPGGGTVVSFLRSHRPLSTHRILLISCQGQTFGIPLAGIETILRVNRHVVESLEGQPMISLDGQLAPW